MRAPHPYASIAPHTATFIAMQADCTDPEELRAAIIADEAEPVTHRAWRRILERHSYIRSNIADIRIARFDQGRPSSSDCALVQSRMAQGFKWHDPCPAQSEIDAVKKLLANMKSLRADWAALRRAEASTFIVMRAA